MAQLPDYPGAAPVETIQRGEGVYVRFVVVPVRAGETTEKEVMWDRGLM